MKTIMVTGGAGFIGGNFIRYMLKRYDYRILNVDNLTYAGNLASLADVAEHANYHFVRADIADPAGMAGLFAGVDAVVNFAAESHVDRSIVEPGIFVRTNVLGVQVLLELALRHDVGRFIQVSTDEVYGSLGPTGYFSETTPLAPNSPYAASKAGGDLLTRAYHKTYGLHTCVTRGSNNFGPYQFTEKLIPLMIINALHDKKLPVYGDGLNVRDWLYVEDHCRAIDMVLHNGRAGEAYNIGGGNEAANIDVVRLILRELGKPKSLIGFVADRPGHDRRYALDASKIKNELGWEPGCKFEEAVRLTVQWYRDNEKWWRGQYQ